ncbi:NAD(P)/FAD-dependent oxidoreductase [Mesorhizobium xinjiangense]|uniref:NAD(P)/FAD-dependent oxidoreductase n=1 Tax=Mesorhizobium xinjiangense TaxID=2678685 RepID=UPI0012EDD7CC|nr:FAD-binding oxidoreductase [Mesorhizobium xinjiangense]
MAKPDKPETDIVIVGAGIVGICAAAYLAETGRRVTVIDRTGVCEETSSGNAAALAFSDVLPLVQKGMLAQVPKWLMDPLGPLSIPPAYMPQLLPWLVRFWRAGFADRYEGGLAAQGALMGLAEAEWMALLERSGTRHMLNEHGALELYDSEAGFRNALPGWQAKERMGFAFEHIDKARLADYQPGLSDHFARGRYVAGWKNVSDPKLLGKALWRHAESKGADFVSGEVVLARPAHDRIAVQLRHGVTLLAQKLVIAAGAWSHRIARGFGDRVPLETERGYNTTLPADAFDVRMQLIFSEHGFVVTPLSTGLRVGGAVELAGLKRPPNFARSRAMLEKTKRFLPGLKTQGGREWMGYRPSLPDSLPVIARAKDAPHVVYAFGHGHLGLTQAAGTGRIVRDLVVGDTPAIDISPFRADRF